MDFKSDCEYVGLSVVDWDVFKFDYVGLVDLLLIDYILCVSCLIFEL